jgi:short-subunit dehydrogenase
MAINLKPISQQVIVITGATSGIGLATARLAAEQGAKLVLAARGEDALRRLSDRIRTTGGEAVFAAVDVGQPEAATELAGLARETYGGFDTWVNNAGVSIYGRLEDVPVEDMRRLFDTNFWGVVYGSLEAVKHLNERGGALINVGSVISDRAVPLQGSYSASKAAVKGFTDSLRMELEHEGAPVSVTLVKPGPIDTPYLHHARNYMDAEPTHVPPVYSPESVGKAILHAAAHPMRDVFVGGAAKGMSYFGLRSPKLTDKAMEQIFFEGSKSDEPTHLREENNLDQSMGNLQERGGYDGHVMEMSVYTEATTHPARTAATLAGVGLAATALWRTARGGFRRSA